MKQLIEIWVAEERLARNQENRERVARTRRMESSDRAPVMVEASSHTILPARGVPFGEYFAEARSHLRHQLLNYKWRVENIHDDQPIETESLVLAPDFGSLRGTEFPMEIQWPADQPPKTNHLLHSPEEIDRLEPPNPAGGLNAKKIAFYNVMKEQSQDFDVRINGNSLRIEATLIQPGGPFPSAFALCGPNLFEWIKTEPERVRHLLELTTRSHRQCLDLFNTICGRSPRTTPWVGADTAEMLSARDFRAFVAPYYNQLWESFDPPRVFHMCGKITHLLDIIRDDMRVDQLDGFGFPVNRELLAEKCSGRLVMRGGPHPMLIRDGPVDAIIAECESYIRTVGRRGGYILSDGCGLPPGTPSEHVEAMVEASKRVGSWTEM